MFRIPVGLNGIIDSDIESGESGGHRWARLRVKDIDEHGGTDRDAVFHNVVARGQTAEAVLRTFQRGDYVAVVGEQVTKAYFERGKRRQTVRVNAAVVAANPQYMTVGVARQADAARAQMTRPTSNAIVSDDSNLSVI